ncbi:TPA: hemagglutinin repeat-containing protein [Salmonella enterica subsp. enterica serovar Bovismorbificans]
MNRLFYRLVFNRARGLLMVVADIARHGRPGSPRRGRGRPAVTTAFTLSPLRFSLWLSAGLVVLPAYADITADPAAPGNQQATVLSTANGLPQVNIQTPNADGVSRNQYSQFDVGGRGAILNNSQGATQTQLAGHITGNPWLAQQEARIILNEVNGRNPAQLNGFIEVAGRRAEVVIASPAGITCNGCGFINAQRATLAAGQALTDGGKLKGFGVNDGRISIEGRGLNAPDADYTTLIARAVNINARMQAAGDIRVTAGRNETDAQGNVTRVKPGDDADKPAFALDVAALGGMYANKIVLEGTERGVGVRNAGELGAMAGELSLRADGRLVNSGTLSGQGDLKTAVKGDMHNTGTLATGGSLELTVPGTLRNDGLIRGGRDVRLTAAVIDSTAKGTLAAGTDEKGVTGATGDLVLGAQGELKAQGQNLAGGRLTATGTRTDLSGSGTAAGALTLTATQGEVSTAGAVVLVRHDVRMQSPSGVDNRGGRVAGDALSLQAPVLDNDGGLLRQTGAQDLSLRHTVIHNARGSLISGAATVLQAERIDNRAGLIAGNGPHLRLDARLLDNRKGTVQLSGSGQLQIQADDLQGREGQLLSAGGLLLTGRQAGLAAGVTQAQQITVSTGSLNNDGGLLSSRGNGGMRLDVTGPLSNRGGRAESGGGLAVKSERLDNTAGTLLAAGAGDLALTTAADTLNAQGKLLAGRHITLDTTRLDNQSGLISATGGSATVNARQDISNTRGRVEARNALHLVADGLNNTGGTVTGGDVVTDTRRGALNNHRGQVAALHSLQLSTGAVDNTAGLLQSGDGMTLYAHGQRLDNTAGGRLLAGALTLRAGETLNQGGTVAAAGDAGLDTGSLSNDGGKILADGGLTLHARDVTSRGGLFRAGGSLLLDTKGGALVSTGSGETGGILSGNHLTLRTGRLDNTGGRLVSVRDLTLDTQGQTLMNAAGLVHAGGTLNLSAGRVDNRDTRQAGKGVEAGTLNLVAGQVDNTAGALRAAGSLNAAVSGALENARGLLSSQGSLTLQGPQLTVGNREGTLIADRDARLSAAALSGDGQVLSQGGLNVRLTQDFHNTGAVKANGDLTFSTDGDVINDGTFAGLQRLTLGAGNLRNAARGSISAQETRLSVRTALDNAGVVDGGLTRLAAATLNNTGIGRIFGDHVAIEAGTLNNLKVGEKAAVIAARDRLDVAAGRVNNRDHALIISAGDMAFGGTLDTGNRAAGQGGELNNDGASVEAGRDAFISMREVRNTNRNLVTQTVEVEKSRHHEGVLSGSTTRYDWSQVDLSKKNKYRVHTARMPDGSESENFYEYRYTRTVTEKRVVSSDPGKILSGGNMTFNTARLANHDSRIVAGGTLGGHTGELDNRATPGERITTETGWQTRWYAKKKRRHVGGTRTSQGRDTDAWRPAPVTETPDLNTLAWQGNTAPQGSGVQADVRQTAGVTVTPESPGPLKDRPLRLPPGQTFTLTLPPDIAGGRPVTPRIVTVSPDIRLPDSSLFTLHPGTDSRYLVETDPRFVNKKRWLTSDYMQNAFITDHNNMHKRLGDGFYEQRLVRDQLIQLTGQRYAGDHTDDEAQYRALMDGGIAFGKRYQLTPGVALTPAQMALLTGDIVWLVDRTVTLPDGSTQTVRVPQVFARLKEGDLSGDGALLGGKNVALATRGDIINSGTITGRGVTQLSAQNLVNSGTVAGRQVSLRAAQDILNTGGQLRGGDMLALSAGRDITSETTTRTDGTDRWLDRPAGMYVQAPNGTLTLSALNNITLSATEISNAGENGTTRLQAGNDLRLETVATRHSEHGNWGGGNTRDLVQQTDAGTRITTPGAIELGAGRDITARAADVNAGGALTAQAGRDIRLTTGNATTDLVEHSKQSSSGFLSKSTTETHDEIHEHRAVGTTFSGNRVVISAGNDLKVQGSSVAGERDVVLRAGNNVTVDAATNTGSYYHMKKTKTSGVFSNGSGPGVTIGSRSSKTVRQGEETTQSDARSLVGASGGNVIIRAGNQVTLSAADVVAGRAKNDASRTTGHIDITASDIAVVPGRDTATRAMKQETKSSGLTLSVKAPFEDTVRNLRDMVRGKDSSGNSTVDRVKSPGAEAGALALDGPGQMVALSVGRSKSTTESHYQGEFNSGSLLSAAGNIQMTATGKQSDSHSSNILIAGSQVNAGEAVILDAKRDISITTSTDKETYSNRSKNSGWRISSEMPTAGSALRATTGGGKHGSQLLPGGMSQSENSSNGARTTQNASVIHGSDIYINSREGSVDIRGSELATTNDLMLSATKGDITVSAGRDTSHNESRGSSKTLGTLGGDGYSATVGYSSEKHSSREDNSLENGLRSELSSQKGNVIAQADGDLSLSGTDIRAGKSVSLSGENVLMDVSRDTRDGESKSRQSQYGVTASAGGWAVDAAKTAETAARSAENGDDPRLTAIRTGQSAVSVAQGVLSDSSVVKGKVSVTAGASSQGRVWHSSDTQGTTLNAGENVAIRARNDIVGQGVQIAGKQVMLDAGQDTLLTAAQNTQAYENKNSSNQFSVGAGVSFIGAQNGISVELGASQQKGLENSSSQRNTNSVIRAEELLTVHSGRDTTLKGAELEGNRVVVNTGRDLTLSSVQDTASYDSQQRSSGVGLSLCIPPLCYGASSGSVSASGENILHDGRSVTNQSGIRAGDGGFAVTTGNHTQLDGAVIASTATAEKNRLDTGTLGWTDIHNESKTAGNSYTVALSGSAGGGGEGENRNVAPVIGAGHVEKESSGTTTSAVSDGSITLRHPENQKQDITGFSRDTENAHHGVNVNGNVQKVRDDLAVQSEGAALAGSALDTYGKYAEKKARESNAALEAKLAARGELDGKTAEQREAYLRKQPGYQNTDYGPGSEYWTKGSAAAGLLAGALGGNLKAGAAAGAAPLLASLVKHVDNDAERAALHGIVAAALTKLSGGNGAEGLKAGAAGAVTASLAGPRLVKALYGKEDAGELTADEKRLVSNLVSVIGGVAGYTTGGYDVSMAAVGAGTARVEVENNSLGSVLAAANKQKPGTVENYESGTQAAIKEACSGNTPVSCQLAVAALGTVMSGGILPEAMVTVGVISAGAVGGVDLVMNGSVDPKNIIAAYWSGALTRYTGFESTVLINAGSSAIVSYMDGKNPFLYGTIGGLGGAIGYGVGNKIIEPMLGEAINPTWKALQWDDIGMGVSQPYRLSPVPGIVGTSGGGIAGEIFNVTVDPSIPEKNKNGAAK